LPDEFAMAPRAAENQGVEVLPNQLVEVELSLLGSGEQSPIVDSLDLPWAP
jgi:hypothetical protein